MAITEEAAHIQQQAQAGTHEQPIQASVAAASAVACVLPCHYSVGYVAFAPHTVVDTLEAPQVEPVPGMPYYAYGLMRWQERWLPLIHLDSLVSAYPLRDKYADPERCLILAYQTQPGANILHGAVAVHALPVHVTVHNEDACALPNNSDVWQSIAISCFLYKGQATPVINTTQLFNISHDY